MTQNLLARVTLYLGACITCLVALVVAVPPRCTPAARQTAAKALTEVLTEGDLICAIVGYSDGTEAKLCRAAAEVGRLIAELATAAPPAPSASAARAQSARAPEALERPPFGAKAITPERRIISVRLIVEHPPPPPSTDLE